MPDCNSGILAKDLAGNKYVNPSYLQIRERINYPIKKYLSAGVLYSYLHNFYLSFGTSYNKPHHQSIDWQKINLEQVIGISDNLFIDKIISAAKLDTQTYDFDIELQAYLQAVNPQITYFLETNSYQTSIERNSKFIVNKIDPNDKDRQSYLFRQVYKKLTGNELKLPEYTVKNYELKGNLKEEMYNHALNHIVNKWNAISIYIWLMAHSTGELQQLIVQPLQNEINYLVKFWAISYWAFSDSFISHLQKRTQNLTDLIQREERHEKQQDEVLEINCALHFVEVTFTFTSVMIQLYQWHKTLEDIYLENLFAYPINLGQTN